MKIGDFKVKRNYRISQMVLDVVAVIIFVVIVRCVISFGAFIDEQNRIIHSANSEIEGLVVWQWNIIWIVIAALVIIVSLLMTYLPGKMPQKYVITKASVMVGNTDGIFTLQIPLDILLSVIIIRFSMHRVRILQPKPEEKEITIKES